ncbi:MAG: tetratricopeptide repeat protein [Cytophagaceae bacterium]
MDAKTEKDLNEAYLEIQKGNYEKGIQLTQRYLNFKDQETQLLAYTVSAIGYFESGNYMEAKEHYKKCADMTNDNQDWFNVCTSATLAKDFELGSMAFQKAMDPFSNQTSNISGPMMTYYYSQALADAGNFSKCREMLEPLKDLYKQIKISDTHYLTTAGMPMLQNFLDVVKKIYNGTKDKSIEAILNDLSSGIDEEGQEIIKQFKAELLRG